MRWIAIATLAVAGQAQADPLQDEVLAGIKATKTADVAFTQTTRAEQTGSKSREFVTRYDPHAAPAARWTLVRVDGRTPTEKERADAAKRAAKSPLPSYAQLADWFGGPATIVGRTAGSVIYRFARLPKGAVKMGGHDVSADAVADAVVNTTGKVPFVERIRLASDKPVRMMLVAKLDRYVFTATYAPLGDGRPFPTATDADISGSLMGKAGSISARTRYTDVRPAR